MKLHRELGFWSVFSIASGAMISSGLFVLPGMVFREAGPAVVLKPSTPEAPTPAYVESYFLSGTLRNAQFYSYWLE